MQVDEEGKRLWQMVTQTVKAYLHIKEEEPQAKPPKPAKVKEVAEKPKVAEIGVNAKAPEIKITLASPPQKPQMDAATKRKLTKGEIRPEAKIDLHGLTQEQAHGALVSFVTKNAKAGKRTLLVITGKGKNMEGVIRKNLPHWLEHDAVSAHIISVIPAAIKDGGAGAFYIRLKNQYKLKK